MRIFRLREIRSGFRQIDFRFLSDALQRAFVISCAQFPTWQRWASLSVGVEHLFGSYSYRFAEYASTFTEPLLIIYATTV